VYIVFFLSHMTTTYFLSQDLVPQPTADFQVLFMPTQPAANSADVNPSMGVPFISSATGFPECAHPDEQYPTQFFAPRSSIPYFQDGYGVNTSVMTMGAHQNICAPTPSPSFQDSSVSPALVSISNARAQFFSNRLPFVSGSFEQQSPDPQHQESVLCRGKRQRDENYRYSLGCISRRVRSWLEKSRPYARAAQIHLEDQLVRDTITFDGTDDNVYELFDEPRKKRFCSQFLTDGNHTLATVQPESSSSGVLTTPTGVMSNPFLFSTTVFTDSVSANSPRGVIGSASVSDDLHTSTSTEQEFIVKFPKQIPPICSTSGIKVQYDELTDRSVLRNWRCRTDEGDVILRRGRKRFFRRVAVLPPDLWQPNKRPQAWQWAPSGPFALHLGEFVSLSGTNGYPYEIVLIRHIPPALRCFLSLVPAPREIALQMLNGDRINPESSFIVHAPVDSVTHKWILNGFRPRDYTREMAMDYINKDIEMERVQKERRKARKENPLSMPEPLIFDSGLLSFDSSFMAQSSEDDLVKSGGSSECLPARVVPGPALVLDCLRS